MRKTKSETSLLLLPHNTTHSRLETIAKGNVKINMNAGTLTMEHGTESVITEGLFLYQTSYLEPLVYSSVFGGTHDINAIVTHY